MNLQAVYVLWLREMKKLFRNKSRLIGSLGMPFFFLAFLGTGFGTANFPGLDAGMDYMTFLTPGIVGMVILFASIFGGLSVLWDRQFGFLKEIMVTPVSRLTIMAGRTLGGVTTAMIQALLLLGISFFLGFRLASIEGLLLALVFMFLTSTSFVALGLALASKMEDMQGFQILMNFLIMPLFLLSGALFPLKGLPSWITGLAFVDPLTYGVDGIRLALLGAGEMTFLTDFVVLAGFCIAMLLLGAWLFRKTEVS